MEQDEQAAMIAAAWQDPTRRLGAWLGDVAPRDAAEGYRIQRAVASRLGAIGGWKVGAPDPEAQPSCAPMPASGLSTSPTTLSLGRFPKALIEAEICLRLGADMPPREQPYTETEVLDAVASCHPAVEILQSRFLDDSLLSASARLGDLLGHGAFVSGEAIPSWREIDFASLGVSQTVTGQPPTTGRGNPAGPMARLLCWLANSGARDSGGLRAGQIVTCGSWTGKTAVTQACDISVRFDQAAELRVTFAA